MEALPGLDDLLLTFQSGRYKRSIGLSASAIILQLERRSVQILKTAQFDNRFQGRMRVRNHVLILNNGGKWWACSHPVSAGISPPGTVS